MNDITLADTSVWVEHLRYGLESFVELLNEGRVVIHPFVIGELACGNLGNRADILALLGKLPVSAIADIEEIFIFIENNRLMGRGLGYVDIHLLASAKLSNARLWTMDKRLDKAAFEMDIGIEY